MASDSVKLQIHPHTQNIRNMYQSGLGHALIIHLVTATWNTYEKFSKLPHKHTTWTRYNLIILPENYSIVILSDCNRVGGPWHGKV